MRGFSFYVTIILNSALGDLHLKRLLAVLLSLIILLILPVGCKKKPPKGADGHFSLVLGAEPVTLDPQVCTDTAGLTLIRAVFEGLATLDEEGKAQPGMAESWDSAGDTVFTFHLREDAKWYGTGVEEDIPLTANDFVFAFRRALSPDTGSSLASRLFCIQNARAVNSGTLPPEALGAYAADDHTLTVTLEYPCPNFPEMTASSVFMPCNEDFFYSTSGKYGISNNTLLTNGPFKFAGYYAWEPYSHIELSRYISYKGERDVWPESLSFHIGEAEIDLSDPVSLLLSEELQAVSLTEDQAEKAEQAGLTVLTAEHGVCGLVFNTEDEQMQYEMLRRIFLGSIDRSFLMEELPPHVQKADDILSPLLLCSGYSYRSLTESSLYYRGNVSGDQIGQALSGLNLSSLPSVSILCEDREDIKQLINQLIICWNGTLGGYFNMEPVSRSELFSRVLSGDYQIALYELAPVGNSVGDLLELFVSGNPGNPAGFSSSVYDQYVRDLYGANALSSCLSAEKYLNDHCVFYPVFYTYSYYGLSQASSGISALPFRGGADFASALLNP